MVVGDSADDEQELKMIVAARTKNTSMMERSLSKKNDMIISLIELRLLLLLRKDRNDI